MDLVPVEHRTLLTYRFLVTWAFSSNQRLHFLSIRYVSRSSIIFLLFSIVSAFDSGVAFDGCRAARY